MNCDELTVQRVGCVTSRLMNRPCGKLTVSQLGHETSWLAALLCFYAFVLGWAAGRGSGL